MKTIIIRLAKVPVRIGLRMEETEAYFRDFLVPGTEEALNDDEPATAQDAPLPVLPCWQVKCLCTQDNRETLRKTTISQRAMEQKSVLSVLKEGASPKSKEKVNAGKISPGEEAYLLMAEVSRMLLPKRMVLFHGAAFCWRGKAWVLTGRSGVGKTTQLRYWQKRWGKELELINGDKTVLRQDADGTFSLHPSPWTGKEGDTGTASGTLAGIVLLKQAQENAIKRLKPEEAVLPVFDQFLMDCESEEEIRAAGSLADALLKSVPVLCLSNVGDEASASLARSAMEGLLQ